MVEFFLKTDKFCYFCTQIRREIASVVGYPPDFAGKNPLCITPFSSFKFYPTWTEGYVRFIKPLCVRFSQFYHLQSRSNFACTITHSFPDGELSQRFVLMHGRLIFNLARSCEHGQNNVLKRGGSILPVIY